MNIHYFAFPGAQEDIDSLQIPEDLAIYDQTKYDNEPEHEECGGMNECLKNIEEKENTP